MSQATPLAAVRHAWERAERLTALFEALPAALIVLDDSGRIRDCNARALSLFGEPLVGELWRDLIGHRFAANPVRGQDLLLRDGRIVRLSTGPLGSIPGQLLLFEEVTEQRRLEERLSGQQRLVDMGKMAATLAHQIRTPLSAALLYVSNLCPPSISDDTRIRFAGKALDNLRALERLIADMLAYARSDSAVESDWIEPGGLLDAARHALEDFLEESGTECLLASFADGLLLRGNRAMLQAALQNLIVNAVQAMGRGGRLRLATRTGPQGSVEIICADGGPGVPPALRERIFEPFMTTRAGGTGLGLAVVRTVAHAHGGEAWVEENPGGGSRFILRLPAVESECPAALAANG